MAAWLTCQPSTSQGATHVSTQSNASPAEETLWIDANGLRLKSNIYRNLRLSKQLTYHYAFAREAATKIDDVVVAALLRPGYRDHTGEHSSGQRGLTTGDNYTPEVVDAVAQAIDQLKAKFNPVRTVLAGHSGGAAILGNLLGRALPPRMRH
jgi:pimeloyl-ACP methyl ester carboxylesterase